MATAVKTANDTSSPTPGALSHLTTASLIGAVYLLVGLVVVFSGMPALWKSLLSDLVRENLGAFFDPFGMGLAILAEASLSFLGVGVPPPEPSWGAMLLEAQR
ncbi:MAG: hypothetical protein K6T59_16640, partial [Bryobacteraceae bacterium]|nr:hypothetical protein [Bryobacteraceae bacterium]